MTDKNQVICTCLNLTLGELEQAVQENPGMSLEELMDKTGAGSVCGMCIDGSNGIEPTLQQIIDNAGQ